jgi:hypothetical protein
MRSVRRPLGRHPPRPRCARAGASVCFSHGPASTRIGSLYPAPFNNAWCAWPKPSSFRKADRSIHRAAVARSCSASSRSFSTFFQSALKHFAFTHKASVTQFWHLLSGRCQNPPQLVQYRPRPKPPLPDRMISRSNASTSISAIPGGWSDF